MSVKLSEITAALESLKRYVESLPDAEGSGENLDEVLNRQDDIITQLQNAIKNQCPGNTSISFNAGPFDGIIYYTKYDENKDLIIN